MNRLIKKIILALLIFGAIVCAPIAKAETLGLTPEMIQQAQTDPEFKALVITYLKTVIGLLQKQLEIMIAQENILNQIAQNTAPSQQVPAGTNVQIQNSMEPFLFEPILKNYDNVSLAVTIKEKFDKCTLTIFDENENKVRQQDTWFKDSEGNARQVYDMGTKGQHTYSITCTKAGFEPNTKTGKFPEAAK